MDTAGRTNESLRLLAIAAAGSPHKPRLVFRNVAGRTDDDLRMIAIAGQGCVVFSDEEERPTGL